METSSSRKHTSLFYINTIFERLTLLPSHPATDTKKTWLIGEGLSVFVGDALWWSCLSKKSTLVLRAESGVYLFQETAGKPDCYYLWIFI